MAQINKPNQYFNTIIYTGDGTTKTITGVGFQPDFVWGKGRNSVSEHALIDSVRGATKKLNSDGAGAEVTNATSFLTGFTSDGYTVDSTSNFNVNTRTQVNWNWLASNTTASNTDGSITSTVSASTTSGFSIVSWTGTGATGTIGHSLGVAPSMIIVKNRNTARNWSVYSSAIGNTKSLFLDLTDAPDTNIAYWNNTSPTSSVFSVGTNGGTNLSGDNLIAYCFAEKKGFSKFGSYTGNGNADGPFFYTGFKPAFVVLKRSDSSPFDWFMHDNKRNGFNPDNDYLQANTSSSETNFDGLIDFVSNGFKIRTTSTAYNASGGTYIYMCFAENPLVGTNNIPATAR